MDEITLENHVAVFTEHMRVLWSSKSRNTFLCALTHPYRAGPSITETAPTQEPVHVP